MYKRCIGQCKMIILRIVFEYIFTYLSVAWAYINNAYRRCAKSSVTWAGKNKSWRVSGIPDTWHPYVKILKWHTLVKNINLKRRGIIFCLKIQLVICLHTKDQKKCSNPAKSCFSFQILVLCSICHQKLKTDSVSWKVIP